MVAEDQGQRRVLIVGAAESEGLDRHEILVETRVRLERIGKTEDGEPIYESIYSARVTQEMTAAGLDELNKRLRVQTFKTEIDPKDFRIKYDLGDIVTCQSKRYGLTIEARVMAYKEVAEDNITTLTLTLGYPEYDIIKELKLLA